MIFFGITLLLIVLLFQNVCLVKLHLIFI